MACNTRAKRAGCILPSHIATVYQCSSAGQTSLRVTQAAGAGAHYNTKVWRCVQRSKHGDGMVHDWLNPEKRTKDYLMGVHIGGW